MDAAASGRNKQLLNDVKETVWSGVELMSDPSTILALAEVTATLCHTLEMEEALYRRTKHGPTSRRRQRLERNQFTQQAYTEPDLMKHYDATVEQVIISGLGADTISDSRSGGGGGPPKSVAFENSGQATFSESVESISVEEQWKKAGRDKVDSNYLEQKIRSRSEQMEQERKQLSTVSKVSVVDVASAMQLQTQKDTEQLRAEIEDLRVENVVEDDDENSGKESQSALQRQRTVRIRNGSTARSKQSVALLEDDDSVHEAGDETPTLTQSSPLVEADSAMSRFYRTLDDVLAKKRSETMQQLVDEDFLNERRRFRRKNDNGRDALHRAVTSMNVINSMASGVSQKKDKDSLAQRLNKWRKAMQGGDSESAQAMLGTTQKSSKKNPVSLLILAALASGFFLLWFGFGCYGMYVFVKARVGSRAVAPAIASVSQEIVIRIVKEVVHVHENGAAIHNGDILQADMNTELFAECVSASIEHA